MSGWTLRSACTSREKVEILKQAGVFLAIVTMVSACIFAWMFADAGNNPPAVLLMMWSPAIAALLASLIFRLKIGDLGWRPGRARFLGLGYIMPVVVSVAGYGLVWLSGLADLIFISNNRLAAGGFASRGTHTQMIEGQKMYVSTFFPKIVRRNIRLQTCLWLFCLMIACGADPGDPAQEEKKPVELTPAEISQVNDLGHNLL